MVKRILEIENVDVNSLAYINDTPLIQCCRIDDNNDMISIAKALLCHPSIQIDKTGNKSELKYSGKTAIHEAAACNSIQIMKLLINRGAIITVHDVH
uniref:Ankyrin repeat protein n=1 Tax=Panagrolaimus superbus TaxID=310955 RepID=A0A914YGK7_9BILA